MIVHGRVADYVDGSMTDEEETSFIFHLAECLACEAALCDDIQLRDREDQLRDRRRGRRLVAQFARASQQMAAVPVASMLVGAAFVVLAVNQLDPLVSGMATSHLPPIGPKLALTATRRIEPRLSHPGAADFRPYDVSRSASGAGEPMSWQVIARLERAGDCHGMGVAFLLSGELNRADTRLADCASDPDLETDRAALALIQGRPGDALALTDGVLVRDPDHPVALWNHALALRDLGLGLTAADGFERVAELDAEWRDEARSRAESLRGELEESRASWLRTVEVGNAMVEGGPAIPVELARFHPARARILLDHAIRTARTRARLEELRPLAESLEGLAGTGIVAHVDQAKRRLTPARLALLDEYQVMALEQTAGPGFARWLSRARAAGAHDLVLAALAMTGKVGEYPKEASRIAARSRNPWIEIDVLAGRAASERRAGNLDAAAALLDDADRRCSSGGPAYRCLVVTLERARLEKDRYRPAVARRLAGEAQRRAEALGEWPQRTQALYVAAEADRFRDEKVSARALYREVARGGANCRAMRAAATLEAELLFDDHHVVEARALAAGRETCGDPPAMVDLVLEVEFLRARAPLRDIHALEADLEEARRVAPAGSADGLLLDYLAARARLDRDPDAATIRLGTVLADARRNRSPLAERVARSAEMALFVTAGEQERWKEAVDIAAEARGVDAPSRCAFAIGNDKFRLTAVALGPTGQARGLHDPDRIPSADWTMPDGLRDALQGCDSIDVLAMPPWMGLAQLMDPAVTWRYVLREPIAPPTTPVHRLVVAAPRPPASAQLPALGPWTVSLEPDTELLTGPSATIERFAAAAGRASLIEIHAHTTRVDDSDAPAIALSEGLGEWALTAERARKLDLRGAPVVVLADCGAGVPARYAHTSWGLPAAFLAAGARSVVAAMVPIPDGEATSFFAGVTADIERGVPVAKAVAEARARKIGSSGPSWVKSVVVFE